MRFAILGQDPLLGSLAGTARRLGHVLAWTGELGDAPPGGLPPPSTSAEDTPWERLLDGDLVDAVFVGRGDDDDRRADQIRRFLQAEVPVLVVHPFCESMLAHFEIEMGREENQSVVQHYTPGTNHPAVAELKRLIETGGRVEQIVVDRVLSDRSRDSVIPHFIRDAELIGRVAGDVNRVATIKTSDATDPFGCLSVQMYTTNDVVVRWSVSPATDGQPCAGRLSLVRESQRMLLHMPDEVSAWRLECAGEEGLSSHSPNSGDGQNWDDMAEQIQRFSAAIECGGSESDWSAAARSVEIADALERSMQKGRTIELHFEQFSEESTFRGLMTSLGCGLLMAGLFVALIAGLVGDAFDIGLAHGWQYILLVLLVVFLLVQLIPRLVIQRDDDKPASHAPDR